MSQLHVLPDTTNRDYAQYSNTYEALLVITLRLFIVVDFLWLRFPPYCRPLTLSILISTLLLPSNSLQCTFLNLLLYFFMIFGSIKGVFFSLFQSSLTNTVENSGNDRNQSVIGPCRTTWGEKIRSSIFTSVSTATRRFSSALDWLGEKRQPSFWERSGAQFWWAIGVHEKTWLQPKPCNVSFFCWRDVRSVDVTTGLPVGTKEGGKTLKGGLFKLFYKADLAMLIWSSPARSPRISGLHVSSACISYNIETELLLPRLQSSGSANLAVAFTPLASLLSTLVDRINAMFNPAGVFELEYVVEFVDACMKHIVGDAQFPEYLPARTELLAIYMAHQAGPKSQGLASSARAFDQRKREEEEYGPKAFRCFVSYRSEHEERLLTVATADFFIKTPTMHITIHVSFFHSSPKYPLAQQDKVYKKVFNNVCMFDFELRDNSRGWQERAAKLEKWPT